MIFLPSEQFLFYFFSALFIEWLRFLFVIYIQKILSNCTRLKAENFPNITRTINS